MIERAIASKRSLLSPSVTVVAFLFVSMLLTTVAFFAFDRAFDHQYFVGLANTGLAGVEISGIDLVDLKAQAVAVVFYAITTPSRLLGGSDLVHVLWVRLATLVGILLCFEWVRRVSAMNLDGSALAKARNRFLLLILLYPGQIAWNVSLLRDGPSCALLFTGLYAWKRKHRIAGLALMFAAIALRPEFIAALGIIGAAVYLVRRFDIQKHRIVWLISGLAILSLLSYEPRARASAFSQHAFAEGGAAYPVINHAFDIIGYFNVLLQGLIDPIPLSSPGSFTTFFALEALFFLYLLATAFRRLSIANLETAGLLIGTLLSLWIFAYFEIFVSGYARHRYALTVLLIAIVSLPKPAQRSAGKQNKTTRSPHKDITNEQSRITGE